MKIKTIIPLILVALTMLFIVQNVATVEIKFLFWSMEISRSLLMLVLLIVGVIVGWFLHGNLRNRKSEVK